MLIGRAPYSVMVVSSGGKNSRFFSDILNSTICSPVLFADSCSEARNKFSKQSVDIVIIDSPLSDENGIDFALKLTENSSCGVIMAVESDVYDSVSDNVGQCGVITVSKPISCELLIKVIKISIATIERIRQLQTENKKLSYKLDEIKLIDRAKRVLIEYLKMSEPQAHKYIIKQAMDMRITRREVAESIIKTYEN